MNVLSVALIALLPVLTACGDKVPESEAAKRIGLVPKQTVDKAVEDTSRALQQGADRTREAEGGGQ